MAAATPSNKGLTSRAAAANLNDESGQFRMITETDIEKLIFRCFANYWNTRESKKLNVGIVSKIAANDVWKVVEQYLDHPNKI